VAVRLEKDVYVLDDRITGLGLNDHDFRLSFNFAPGKLTGGGFAYQYETPKGRRYMITAGSDAELTPAVLEGSEDPIGGWVSYGYSRRVPAPQLTLKRQGKVPFRCVTVIAPAGCETSVTFEQDRAVVTLNGVYHTHLTLRGDEIERK
jgi:hypothetical protein